MSTIPSGQRLGITQTVECAVAIGRIFAAVSEAREDDGKVSGFEALGMLRHSKAVYKAVSGIGEVPGELLDCSADELNEITRVLVQEGVVLDDAEKAERVNIIMSVVWSVVAARHKWKNIGKNTPVATVVDAQ